MSKRPTVYVVQEPMKRDEATGQMVSIFNFAKALEYGEVKICLPPGNIALSAAPTTFQLHEALADFDDKDYLLCAGDPTAIAMAGAVAAMKNRGKIKLLKRDRDTKKYIQVDFDVYQKLGAAR